MERVINLNCFDCVVPFVQFMLSWFFCRRNLFNRLFKIPSSKPKVCQESAESLKDVTEKTGPVLSTHDEEVQKSYNATIVADTKEDVPIKQDPILTEVADTLQTTIDVLETVEYLLKTVTEDFNSQTLDETLIEEKLQPYKRPNHKAASKYAAKEPSADPLKENVPIIKVEGEKNLKNNSALKSKHHLHAIMKGCGKLLNRILPGRAKDKLPPGFSNKDAVSCYANAICQCLLSFNAVVKSIKNENSTIRTLKDLCQQHATGKAPLDTRKLRKEMGWPFSARQQQDAEEFLTALINRNECLEGLTTNIVTNTKKCRHPSCGYETTSADLVNVVRLATDSLSGKSTNMVELIEEISSWKCLDKEVTCDLCHDLCALQSRIETPAEILICQVMLWTTKGKKKSIEIEGVADTIFPLGGKQYQLQAAVFHKGTGTQSGHYTAIKRRGTKWIDMDDKKVSIKSSWPHKTPYLLFYQEVQP
ncbi:hypothetical protein JTE90_026675 [Oedothorax gibbosus]|uniref:USP domain-containing protein n=1 Tax=Oedothorax gibbosus TaxID=931172 RepID=A0AAV6TSU9_9ARAC|nr:hypothetical protein JTE90_026675 [Oedothorax gibbosus]